MIAVDATYNSTYLRMSSRNDAVKLELVLVNVI